MHLRDVISHMRPEARVALCVVLVLLRVRDRRGVRVRVRVRVRGADVERGFNPFRWPGDGDGKATVDRPRVYDAHARADGQRAVVAFAALGAFELHPVAGEAVAEDFAVRCLFAVADAVGSGSHACVRVGFCAALDLCGGQLAGEFLEEGKVFLLYLVQRPGFFVVLAICDSGGAEVCNVVSGHRERHGQDGQNDENDHSHGEVGGRSTCLRHKR